MNLKDSKTRVIFFSIIISFFLILSYSQNPSVANRNEIRNYQTLGWSEDVRISNENNDFWSVFTHIASTGPYIHVLWDEHSNFSGVPGKGLCYRRSSDGGNTWGNIFPIADGNSPASNNIAVSSSTVHILYTLNGLHYRKSNDNGETWEPVKNNITEFSGTDINIEAYKNNIHIVWSYRNESIKSWCIFYLRSIDNGETWNQAQYLVSGYGITNYLRPRLTVCEKNIYVVFWGVNDTIELLSSYDNGDSWYQKQIYSGPNVGFPEIAGEGSKVGIVWIDKSDLDHFQLQFTRSIDKGLTWSNPVHINDWDDYLDISQKAPSMSIVRNTIHIVWADYRDCHNESEKTYTEIYYKKGIDAGQSWTEDIRLTKKDPPGPDSRNPSIAVANNNIYIVWEDERKDRKQIYFKRTLPDFIVDNLTIESLEQWANTSINLNLFVKNIGFADGYFINITVEYLDKVIFKGQIENIHQNAINTISFPWTPLHSGSNTLKIIIDNENTNQEWDENNNVLEKDFLIQENGAPIAKLKVEKTIAKAFENITFDLSESYDPDGAIGAYFFNYGDGNNSGWIKESIIIYNYSYPGIFECFAKVRDDHNAENFNIVKQEIDIEWCPLPPIIDNVIIDPFNPVCNENVTISVSSFDLNQDPLEYIYIPENSSIIGAGKNVTWQAPEKPGGYKITIQVFDGKFYSSPWILNISVNNNRPPVIHNINYSANKIKPSESVNISINASDPDGHILKYSYQTSSGKIIDNGSSIIFHGPKEPGIYIIYINVSDLRGGYDHAEIFIIVDDPVPSCLIKSFKIIPDKIYKDENSEIFIELEIDENYTAFIDAIYINLSSLTGNPSQILFDNGLNGDAIKNDGIFSYKSSMTITGFTGEHRIWATLKTIIPNFQLNSSTTFQIVEKPKESVNKLEEFFIGFIIIFIVILIVALRLLFRRKINSFKSKKFKRNNLKK